MQGRSIVNGIVESDAAVALFNRIVQNSYTKIYTEMTTAKVGSSMNTAARRKALLDELRGIVDQTHIDLNAWAIVAPTGEYLKGADQAVIDMQLGGQTVSTGYGFQGFHKEAIASLVNNTSTDIAAAMTGMTKMVETMVGDITRTALLETIAVGSVSGDSLRKVQKALVRELKLNGLDSLVDKSGRTWALGRYGEMLARTKLTRAHKQGVTMRLAQEGNDLVIVSDHQGACPQCQPYENEVLSASGRTEGYTSLSEAEAGGLFHPSCRHVVSAVPNDTEYLKSGEIWNADQQKYVPFNESGIEL